ncbi:MAG: alanyl-tRNA editing protein, partial [Caldilineaceae bacterium]|nr:alanyl-tRNA editing protein [Caldilineaceae bacterium]
MTHHLYYADSYTTEFDAQILAITTVDGHPAALLDRSYFYPTSGGQQHDTGTLNGVDVVDVQANKDGEILHILAAPLSPSPAHGLIDWPRRIDHMQQHTGQHLLSAAFTLRHNMETVSVHFGAEVCMLELDTDSISDAQ